MSQFKSFAPVFCSLFIFTSIFSSAPLHAGASIPTSNSTSVDVASVFIKRLDSSAELAAGAALMALKDVKIVGGFASDTGVYMVLASIFDLGDEVKRFASQVVPSLSEAQAHFVSAGVLYLVGFKTYKIGTPTTALDFASIFFRASAANQISATIKAVGSGTGFPELELALAVPAVAFAFGPLTGGQVNLDSYNSQFFKSLVITSAYRAKDLGYFAMNQIGGLSDIKSHVFTAEFLTAAAYLAMQYASADTVAGVFSDFLVEASFFGATLVMSNPVLATAAVASWAIAKSRPGIRVLAQAESGIRQGFVIFTLAPMVKSIIPWVYQTATGNHDEL